MNNSHLLSIKQHIRSSYDMGVKFGKYEVYNDETFYDILEEIKRIYPNILNDEEIIELKKIVDSEFLIFQDDGVAILDDYEHKRDWYTKIKDKLKEKYWERYRAYLFQKGWSTDVLNKLELDTLDNLMNYLGDPSVDEHFSRKGLVMGDVQSGKTSNYIGLICKAADAGYKVIILLTGTLESLRKQTQIRVEEGFVGYDSEKKEAVGVGHADGIMIPKTITSREHDFTGNLGNNTMLKFNDETAPFIFITKKNPTTLRKIRETIANINIRFPQKKIETAVLIIDDEADNASVNTNDSKYDPTKINAEIRKLTNLFTKSNYVGFTATPFANVFIDPDSETEMLKSDLFPSDFIYSLNAPSNYFGANRIFLSNKYETVQIINDANDLFPLNHKKEWSGTSLFPSLIEAINAFLIINVIRDINEKSQKNSHRSMLINVSRFIKVQDKIAELVDNRVNKILNAVKYNHRLNKNEYSQNQYISDLEKTYKKHYSKSIEWDVLMENLYTSIQSVVVYKVPNKLKEPNYEKHSEIGLRCIVIGGLALSRGLTLEGLTISYLYRNTSTFDVLMQMGRWFGYRDKPADYSNLCKVWMLPQTKNFFEEITKSIEILREDIKQMSLIQKKPREFGIRVRNESDILGITSKNKMRTTKKFVYTDDLFGRVLETPFIDGNIVNIKNNMIVINDLLLKNKFEKIKGNLYAKSVSSKLIMEFLQNYNVHEANSITYFEKEQINNFIKDYKFDEFDIIVIGLKNGITTKIGNYDIVPSTRSFDLLTEDVIRLSRARNRLGGTSDTRLPNQQKLERSSNALYLEEGRNPVLLIYPLNLIKPNPNEFMTDEEKKVEQLISENVLLYGIGIGFPRNSEFSSKRNKVFYINDRTKWRNIMYEKDGHDYDEDEKV